MYKLIWIMTILTGVAINSHAKDYTLTSPDGTSLMKARVDHHIQFEVWHRGEMVLITGPISMTFDRCMLPDGKPVVRRTKHQSVNETIRSRISAVWENTKVLYAEADIAMVRARKHGHAGYVGGMTNYEAFHFDVSLDFLDDEPFDVEILTDGVNVDQVGKDYKIHKAQVKKSSQVDVKMAPGGSFALVLTPVIS